MGRHSSSGEGSYYRSMIAWVLPWVLIATSAGAVVWLGVGWLGGEGVPKVPPSSQTRGPEPTGSPSPAARLNTSGPRPTPRSSPDLREIQGAGITLQVLNASSDPGAEDRVVARLEELGFEIVAVAEAAARYEQTTVFWSTDEDRPDAEELASAMGWRAEAKPANLSDTVRLHVVVGEDESEP